MTFKVLMTLKKGIAMYIKEDNINVYKTSKLAGYEAGKNVEQKILELLENQDVVRMIFAAAPSQDYMLEYLRNSDKIDWSRIIAFNMDEYIGLKHNAPESFATFLNERLFNKLNFKEVNLIDPSKGINEEIHRITQLINANPIDIVCLGIGQNGHLAFNDPPVANFEDPYVIKEVTLDYSCREQQVIDACFPSIDKVPTNAMTLTIPTLMSASYLFCVVVGSHKADAVNQTLNGDISIEWPSTILREHKNCSFYFDELAFKKIL